MEYRNIQNEADYHSLLNCGMFFEFHPELKGNWDEDKIVILEEELANLKQRYIHCNVNSETITNIKNILKDVNRRYATNLMFTIENTTLTIKERPPTITFRM